MIPKRINQLSQMGLNLEINLKKKKSNSKLSCESEFMLIRTEKSEHQQLNEILLIKDPQDVFLWLLNPEMKCLDK